MAQDLFGNTIAPRVVQRDLLAGRAGLGVEGVARVIGGVEYIQVDGYWLRADGLGVLMVNMPIGDRA
jgi:hypothetical protein